MTQLLTTKQAAELLGISGRRVRAICKSGRLGRKQGRDWVITAAEVKRYKPLATGHPKGE